MRHAVSLFSLSLVAASLITAWGCADAPPDDNSVPPDLEVGEEVPELGKALFAPAEEHNAKEDSFVGRKGMPTSVDQGQTVVWDEERYEGNISSSWGALSGEEMADR